MKKITAYCLLITAYFLQSSCKTDFDVTADWKEIAVVYGILDKNDTTHYIRINKAYLGDADAIIMGWENDSINYENLTVRLIELTETGTAVDSFLLEETTVGLEMLNDTGVFGDIGNPLQKLWKTTETLDQSKIYRLRITNPATDNVITSETAIVKNFTIVQPSANPQSKITFIGNNDAYSAYGLKFSKSATDNGKVYEATLIFYYRDVNIDTHDTTLQSVSWKQSAYVADVSESLIQINIEGENFYNYIKTSVAPLPANYKRLIGKGEYDVEHNGNFDDHIDIIINVGGEELYNYIEINKPAASGVLLDKPVYTNIEGGLGIFSSRGKNSVINKSLSDKSINELKNGSYTGNLGFRQEND